MGSIEVLSEGQFFGIHVSNNGKIMIFAGGIPLDSEGQVVGAALFNVSVQRIKFVGRSQDSHTYRHTIGLEGQNLAKKWEFWLM